MPLRRSLNTFSPFTSKLNDHPADKETIESRFEKACYVARYESAVSINSNECLSIPRRAFRHLEEFSQKYLFNSSFFISFLSA